MKAWFDKGFHLIIDSIHVLFDPMNPKNFGDSESLASHPDPPKTNEPDLVLVSHGHSDHSNMVREYPSQKKIMHKATQELISRYKPIQNVETLIKERGRKTNIRYKPIEVKGLKIEAYNSGHCIGAVQFKITSSEGTFVFTGDINTFGSNALKGGEILDGDVLAIESTMGKPNMINPNNKDGIDIIHDVMKSAFLMGDKYFVIYGHAIGKGQEITKMVNYFGDMNINSIYVDKRVFHANQVYEKYMLPLGKYYEITDEKSFGEYLKENGDKRIVFLLDLYKLVKNKHTAMKAFDLEREPASLITTAIEKELFKEDLIKDFPILKISSHDDWNSLNNYVDKFNPDKEGKIITFHGEHKYFADHLRKRGYDAIDSHEEILSF